MLLILAELLANCTCHIAPTVPQLLLHKSTACKQMGVHLQELLQQMLHVKLGSPATQSPTSPSSTVSSRPLTAARTAPEPPYPAQPKRSVAAASKCAPISKQSSGQSARDHSVLPLECHQDTETARTGVSPFSSRNKSIASAKEGDITGKQAVNVVAKPQLYSALTAAVSAIVQQAGLAQCQPAEDCLKGISLQYHAGQGAQPEGQGFQLKGQGALPQGHSSQLEGQKGEVTRQQNCAEGQHAGHEGQQTWHEGQQQIASPSRPEAPATVFATSLPGHMASQSSCRQSHQSQVSAQHSAVDDSLTRAQHANHVQHSAADSNGARPSDGQQVACGEGGGAAAAGKGGLAVGQEGLDEGLGRAQAWQIQIEQAMQVLQAALQCSSKTGEPPAVVR